MDITRGMRGKVFEKFSHELPLNVTMKTSGPAVYDYCCFGVNEENKLSDDRYMIFYNQTISPDNEISYHTENSTAIFSISLNKLPESIRKLVFTASIDGDSTMGKISDFEVTIGQDSCEPLVLHMTGTDFSEERAIISVELYIKSEWRYSAVAMGFNGGLSDLLEYYGGEEISDNEDLQQENVISEIPMNTQDANETVTPTPEYITPSQTPTPATAQPVQQNEGEIQSSAVVSLKKLGDKPVSLKKNEKVELRKHTNEIVSDFIVGLGWDPAVAGTSIDCDSSVILCKNGRLRSSSDIVAFYNQNHSTHAVIHHGDNLTGHGDGDDEQIEIHLDMLPEEYDRIAIVVNIFLSRLSGLHFGKIRNCYMRICDTHGRELCRYTLSDNSEYNKMSAMIFGEFTKENGIWIFNALGQGTKDHSIGKLAKRYKKG